MFEDVDVKRVDPDIVLGRLVAAIRRVAWWVDLLEQTTVWPASP